MDNCVLTNMGSPKVVDCDMDSTDKHTSNEVFFKCIGCSSVEAYDILNKCLHVVCKQCLSSLKSGELFKCPSCGEFSSEVDLINEYHAPRSLTTQRYQNQKVVKTLRSVIGVMTTEKKQSRLATAKSAMFGSAMNA